MKTKKFLAINIGNYKVTVSECSVDEDLISIVRSESAVLKQDWESSAPHMVKLNNALSEALSLCGSKVKECVVSIPASVTFERFIKLPTGIEGGVENNERKELIINFEARQNIPFPIDEVLCKYIVFPSGDTNYPSEDCVFSVITKEKYMEIEVILEENGLKPFLVTSENCALLNGFNVCRGYKNSTSVLIDVGHRNTNIIFVDDCENGPTFMMRTVPLGGHSVLQQVCKEFGTGPDDAKSLLDKYVFDKTWDGEVETDVDPKDVKNYTRRIARNVYSRIHGELNRSTSVYRAHSGSGRIEKAYVVGGAIPESCKGMLLAQSAELEKITSPKGKYALDADMSKNLGDNLAIIGLAEMVANKDTRIINFCEKKSSSSIMWSIAKGLARIVMVPLRIRCKLYLKEKKNAR